MRELIVLVFLALALTSCTISQETKSGGGDATATNQPSTSQGTTTAPAK